MSPLFEDIEVRPAPDFYGASSAASPEIQVVNPLTDPEWDERVGTLPQSHFFHGAAWARVLHETYGFQPAYFVALKQGRLSALLPFMEVDGFVEGRRGIALPFSDHVEPLAHDSTQLPRLLAAMEAHGRRRGWRTWEIRSPQVGRPDTVHSVEFLRHELDLALGPATLYANFDPAVRRALRKAEKAEVRIRGAESVEAMRTYFELHCRTRRRHGLPPQPWEFFENLWRYVIEEGHGRLLLAYYQGEATAGAVFVHAHRSALYKFGASDENHLDLRPNNHLFWYAIKTFALDGFERLDFGRTSLSNAGLRRFKLAWGAHESRFACTKYDLRRNAFVKERDPVKGWYNPLFRNLPLPVLRFVGERLYRHLA